MARRPTLSSSALDRRVAERAPVAIEADLRKPGRTPFRVEVRDLSRTGCSAATVSRTIVGDRIWLKLPGFSAIEGIVRWSTPQGFGCQWVRSIHPSVFHHICTAYPHLLEPPPPCPL
jgi:hypothetical protein